MSNTNPSLFVLLPLSIWNHVLEALSQATPSTDQAIADVRLALESARVQIQGQAIMAQQQLLPQSTGLNICQAALRVQRDLVVNQEQGEN
jgi:hypothetical protein